MAQRKSAKHPPKKVETHEAPASPAPGAACFRRVARLSELPEGAKLRVELDALVLALFNVAGKIYVLDDTCAHGGREVSLSQGAFDGEELLCPLHGWRLSLAEGCCVNFPEVRVRTYAVELRGGEIFVRC